MARLVMSISDMVFLPDGQAKEKIDCGILTVTCSINGSDNHEFPSIRFLAEVDQEDFGSTSRTLFSLDSYEDIDALRRYCEMTLQLFDAKRLG